jgi:hypothetical protein
LREWHLDRDLHQLVFVDQRLRRETAQSESLGDGLTTATNPRRLTCRAHQRGAIRALEWAPCEANRACPAALNQARRYAIASLELRHLRAYLDHDSGDLVPAQHWHREHADVLSGDRQIGVAKTGGPDINEYFSPQRMCQLHFSDRETGANGVNDCGFHPSSSSISRAVAGWLRRFDNI